METRPRVAAVTRGCFSISVTPLNPPPPSPYLPQPHPPPAATINETEIGYANTHSPSVSAFAQKYQ